MSIPTSTPLASFHYRAWPHSSLPLAGVAYGGRRRSARETTTLSMGHLHLGSFLVQQSAEPQSPSACSSLSMPKLTKQFEPSLLLVYTLLQRSAYGVGEPRCEEEVGVAGTVIKQSSAEANRALSSSSKAAYRLRFCQQFGYIFRFFLCHLLLNLFCLLGTVFLFLC